MPNRNREVIVGTEGTQTMPIRNKFVSRQHARVTYDASSGLYHVEDLGSANGTYVISLMGGIGQMQMSRIHSANVSPGTWINLGGVEAGTGQRVLVDHLFSDTPDDYSAEFRSYSRYLAEYHYLQDELEKKQKQGAKVFAFVKIGISLVFIGFVAVLQQLIPALRQITGLTLIASMMTMAFCSLFNWDGTRAASKALKKNASQLFLCPKCGRPLNEFSINQLECASCGAH